MEQWKAISGYEGLYEVSDMGRVMCLPRYHHNANGGYITKKKIKKQRPDSRGYYLIVDLINGEGKKVTRLVHRIVAKHFIENPLNLPQVNHKKGNKKDNRKSTRLNSSHVKISYAVFCLKKKKKKKKKKT